MQDIEVFCLDDKMRCLRIRVTGQSVIGIDFRQEIPEALLSVPDTFEILRIYYSEVRVVISVALKHDTPNGFVTAICVTVYVVIARHDE